MSEHRVEVISIQEVLPHPNADKLEIIPIGRYQCLSQKGLWKAGDLAVYIEPDYVVPNTEEYSFLKGHLRIKAKKLRGTWSQGLLMPAPAGAKEGDNVMEQLAIQRYEPNVGMTIRGDAEPGPEGLIVPKYDVENWYRYGDLFVPGEDVIATEKLHGANARYVFSGDRMYAGSRNFFIKYEESNLYWSALRQNPWIEEWCRNNHDLVLYGEAFGWVQKLRYGASPGQHFFRAFDILKQGNWLSLDELTYLVNDPLEDRELVRWAPVIYRGPYDAEKLKALAEGPSMIYTDKGSPHLREGIVVRPVKERWSPELMGRVQLKIVSNAYLEGDF